MTDPYSIGKRLKEYIRSKKLKQNAVAQRVDVTPGFISQIVNGEEAITSKVLAGLVRNFADLNIDWLLRGEGDMFLEKKSDGFGGLMEVSEPDRAAYERTVRGGILEEALSRLTALEDKVGEMEERLRGLEGIKKKD